MQESDERRWAALMVNAQAGHQSDYQQLLGELTNVIHHFLISRFGSNHFIEDCVQEILITIHQARHTYNPQRPFRPWMFAIVRHKAIDMFRQRRTREKVVEHYKREQEILFKGSNPDEASSEIAEGQLLGLLSPPHKEVLVLTKVIGFSVAETAKKLGISESAVKVRVFRAARKLRQLLEEDEL